MPRSLLRPWRVSLRWVLMRSLASSNVEIGRATVSLKNLMILVVDKNLYMSAITIDMLRRMGANKLIVVRNVDDAILAMAKNKIDILLCDTRIPPTGGLALTRSIRSDPNNAHRKVPILIMSGDPNEPQIRQARDAGANFVIKRPMSAACLYDRLTWIVFNPRPFVETPTYFGPDRRFRNLGYRNGVGRRKGDNLTEGLTQNDIDGLFNTVKTMD
jgi:two-component system, chemotaxis family, chemotaxis protein CheY